MRRVAGAGRLAPAVLLLGLLLLAPPSPSLAQVNSVVIRGQVRDVSGVPVPQVEVRVEGTSLVALTDSTGRFVLTGVPAGVQTLRAERIGYATSRTPVTVPVRGSLQVDLQLSTQALQLEGLTVTADASGRARGEVATATVVESEAIRHQTATSLAGVLELLPGVELSPPTVGGVQQISLRAVGTSTTAGGTSTSDLASFGTLIVLDGVPLSNNANLQTLGPRGEVGFGTSAGGGVDLRQIPAATLERVEVIRGVPSARYGDLTQGAIIVDTRAGAYDPEARVQYDARTTEASAMGGWDLGRSRILTANLDYARTRSSPGVSDDHSNRVAAQVRYATELGGGAAGQSSGGVRLDTRLDVYGLRDDQPEDTLRFPGSASWSHESGIRVGERVEWGTTSGVKFSATASATRLWQDSYRRAVRVRGAMPFTNRLTEGRSEGWYVAGPYEAEFTVNGAPWLAYGRLEAEAERSWFSLRHDLRAGAELRREWNHGRGYQFDMERPPQVSFNGVQGYDRPRSYADIPALATTGVYVDDRARGLLGESTPYTLQLGLRADVLHEGGSWLPKPSDVVIEPRIAGEVSVRPWLRLRAGWGRMAKAPGIANLYPAPQYNDVVNVNWYANAPDERLAVLTTSIFDPTNPDLGFSVAQKTEAGFEVGGGASVLSVVGFRDRIDGGVGFRQDLTYLLRDHYQLTDSVTGNGIPPEIIEPASGADTVPIRVQRPTNYISVESHGLEITATLPEIPRLRTRLQIQGSWVRTERQGDEISVGSATRFSDFQLRQDQQRTPYWEGTRSVGEKYLVMYRIVHHQPDLGLVVTATIQQNLKDLVDDPGSRDTLSWAGYITRDARLVPVPAADRALPEYQDLRRPQGGLIEPLSAPRDWMMGLQVAKTLPLEGELRFWAFNALDRVGKYGELGGQARLYARMQFGVELNMKPGAVWGGIR